jgi:L-lactate dehydrogenase complex protein LldE
VAALTRPGEVALFVTCLVDAFYPEVAEDALWLLEKAGVRVTIPSDQTCCGQPPYNSGFWNDAQDVAAHFLDVFAGAEAIVTPSGSCAAMVRQEYPHLFHGDPQRREAAQVIAGRTYELSQFLVNVLGVTDFSARWPGRATYHDACHGNRALAIAAEPRALLARVEGLELVEMPESNWCCGFGGAFAAKLPVISGAMLDEKVRRIETVGVDTVITGDTGCLMHLNGGLQRRGKPIRVLHFAQVLRGRP